MHMHVRQPLFGSRYTVKISDMDANEVATLADILIESNKIDNGAVSHLMELKKFLKK